MKIITIQKSVKQGGYVASVNGFINLTAFASDEVTALKHLYQKIEERDSSWIKDIPCTPSK